jgi:hypothetical protein
LRGAGASSASVKFCGPGGVASGVAVSVPAGFRVRGLGVGRRRRSDAAAQAVTERLGLARGMASWRHWKRSKGRRGMAWWVLAAR